MTDAPNYREVRTCGTCKYALVDYDWYVVCEKFKDAGSDCRVCDDWELAFHLTGVDHIIVSVEEREKAIHAEFNIEGGEIKTSGFVGGEINVGDEVIIGKIDPSAPLFGEAVEVYAQPFLGVLKGDIISITGYGQGEETDYIVMSLDENGMTVKEVD